jgi:putative ABC transport system permease protein
MRIVTSFVGAVVEAWQEVRVHRGRVLLSLVGVTVAVCALSASVAVTEMAQQAVVEQAEASSGRPFTMTGNIMPNGTAVPGEADAAWFETLDRFGISYATRTASDYAPVALPGGAVDTSMLYVDQPYATLHRTRMLEGSWFAPGDRERLAPAVVVNAALWEQLGSPDLATHPVISSSRFGGADLVVTGVYASSSYDTDPGLMMLMSSAQAALPEGAFDEMMVNYEMWVPEETGEELMGLVSSDLTARLGEAYTVDVFRTDYGVYMDDPTAALRAAGSPRRCRG